MILTKLSAIIKNHYILNDSDFLLTKTYIVFHMRYERFDTNAKFLTNLFNSPCVTHHFPADTRTNNHNSTMIFEKCMKYYFDAIRVTTVFVDNFQLNTVKFSWFMFINNLIAYPINCVNDGKNVLSITTDYKHYLAKTNVDKFANFLINNFENVICLSTTMYSLQIIGYGGRKKFTILLFLDEDFLRIGQTYYDDKTHQTLDRFLIRFIGPSDDRLHRSMCLEKLSTFLYILNVDEYVIKHKFLTTSPLLTSYLRKLNESLALDLCKYQNSNDLLIVHPHCAIYNSELIFSDIFHSLNCDLTEDELIIIFPKMFEIKPHFVSKKLISSDDAIIDHPVVNTSYTADNINSKISCASTKESKYNYLLLRNRVTHCTNISKIESRIDRKPKLFIANKSNLLLFNQITNSSEFFANHEYPPILCVSGAKPESIIVNGWIYGELIQNTPVFYDCVHLPYRLFSRNDLARNVAELLVIKSQRDLPTTAQIITFCNDKRVYYKLYAIDNCSELENICLVRCDMIDIGKCYIVSQIDEHNRTNLIFKLVDLAFLPPHLNWYLHYFVTKPKLYSDHIVEILSLLNKHNLQFTFNYDKNLNEINLSTNFKYLYLPSELRDHLIDLKL